MISKVTQVSRQGVRVLDFPMIVAMVILLTLGLVMVYSSSAANALKLYGDGSQILMDQLMRMAIGLLLLLVMAMVPSKSMQRRMGWVLLVALLICGVVLIPGLGVFRGGARRWLSLGGLSFQPSEFAKIAMVIVVAAILARRERQPLQQRSSLFVPALIAQIPVALILGEPDLGTALVLEMIIAVMIFVAGVRLRTLLVLALAALPVFYTLIFSTPFRLRRLLAYIDPWAYRQTVGYQVTEAQIAIGSGGLTGLGLGEGKHGLFFLPEAHTDFIFALVAQELGLIGVSCLLLAFGVLLWRATDCALLTEDPFERYLAVGLTALIGIPVVFNTCVVTGLLPTKGLPLPLISYGGSNLIVTLASLGILLRIASDVRRQQHVRSAT